MQCFSFSIFFWGGGGGGGGGGWADTTSTDTVGNHNLIIFYLKEAADVNIPQIL